MIINRIINKSLDGRKFFMKIYISADLEGVTGNLQAPFSSI